MTRKFQVGVIATFNDRDPFHWKGDVEGEDISVALDAIDNAEAQSAIQGDDEGVGVTNLIFTVNEVENTLDDDKGAGDLPNIVKQELIARGHDPEEVVECRMTKNPGSIKIDVKLKLAPTISVVNMTVNKEQLDG